ncbi:MAG: helix-hairpin-helix domain-containing protein [Bacillota bacterium]
MSKFQKYKKWIMVISILVALISYYYYYFIKDSSSSVLIRANEEEEPLVLAGKEEPFTETTEEEIDESTLVIDIKGAIVHPGVYEMQSGARVHQLIKEAGGLNDDADELAINLAAPLEDGMVIYIPKKGEIKENPLTMPTGQEENQEKVNINLATSDELQTLTGIGPSKAEAIITYREENGPFKAPEGLLEVSGIGEKSLEKMKEEITIK